MAMLISVASYGQIVFSVSTPVEDSHGDWLVNIIMKNGSTQVTGFQCDLTIPSDFSYEMGSYSFTDRCKKMKQGKMMETHNLTGNAVSNGGTIRLDVFSNDIDEIQDIQGSDGSVVTLRLSGLSTAKASALNLTNIVVVTLDEDGFPGIEPIYPNRVIGDSTLACYDAMGGDVLVLGELTETQLKEINSNLKTCPDVTSVDVSKCTNTNLGTLDIPAGSSPEIYLASKGQVTNKTSRTYFKKNGRWAIESLDILDTDASFSLDRNLLIESASYTRNFKNTSWQAWHMPFTVPVEELLDDYEFAEFCGVSEDEDNIYIHTNYVTEGNLKANKPYLVKANATGSRKLAWTDILASKSVPGTVSFSSANYTFTFTGTYSKKADMFANGLYALSGGELAKPSSASVTLGAFRWFLDFSSSSEIRKRVVLSFDELVDAIQKIGNEDKDGKAQIYDMSGRPVSVMGKGVYIMNGKKLMK